MDLTTNMYQGMILALGASVLWSLSPVFFSSAGRRIGSYQVNLLRLAFASILLSISLVLYALITGRSLQSPGMQPVVWLGLSALVGLVAGDAFYLQSLIRLGPRRTMQLMTLSPIVSVVVGWIWQSEAPGPRMLAGIIMIVAGVLYAAAYERSAITSDKREPGVYSAAGYFLAAFGTVCHGLGAVFARQAFIASPEMDPFVATVIRVVSAASMIWVTALASGTGKGAFASLRKPRILPLILLGTLAGPGIGMVLYVSAFKFASAGVVSTLAGLSPILVIPIVAIRYRSRVGLPAIIGTILAVAGVVVMTWK